MMTVVGSCTHASAIDAISGKVLFDVKDLLRPLAIHFDALSQTVFIADADPSRNTVRIYDSKGNYAGEFGAVGGVFGPGEPRCPRIQLDSLAPVPSLRN